MTKDEALKLALEALENVQYYGWGQTERDYDARTAAITALRKALAEQPAQSKPLTDEEIKRRKPISADFVSFRAGVRCMEREYRIGEKR